MANTLGKSALSQTDYTDRGRFSFTTVCRRFGSWKAALVSVGLEPAHLMNVSADELLADVRRVARELNSTRLRFHQYIEHGKYSRKVINRLFGCWQNATETAGLTPVIRRPHSRQELFDNLKQLWQKLGRRPRYEDVVPPLSKFGVTAYTYRFGTFRKALAAFLESSTQASEIEAPSKCSEEDRSRGFVHRTPRTVHLRLRFTIMRRDCFRCCASGRSPANDPGVILQVDHKIAWAHGGETVAENLHTLCRQCNAGKSDLDWME